LKAIPQPAGRPARGTPVWWGRILVESVLIVFSILLALFVDEWRDQRHLDEQRDRALSDIHSEIVLNLAAVDVVVDYHRTVRDSLGALLQRLGTDRAGASAWELAQGAAPAGIQRPGVTGIAWQTAAASEAVALLDIGLTNRLGSLYDIQAKGVESTIERVQELLFDPILFDPARAVAVLRVLQALAHELAGQEIYLAQRYREILADPAFTELERDRRESETGTGAAETGESR
jgi:hypothetical protein